MRSASAGVSSGPSIPSSSKRPSDMFGSFTTRPAIVDATFVEIMS